MKIIVKLKETVIHTFELTDGKECVLGSSSEVDFSVAKESYLSRRHIKMQSRNHKLSVTKFPNAKNPVFFKGVPNDQFKMSSEEFFVIGTTSFQFISDVPVKGEQQSLEDAPAYQFTVDTNEIRSRGDHQDRMRLLDLMELPEVLRTKTRTDFYVYACGLLRMTTGANWVRVLTVEDDTHTILAEDAHEDRSTEKPISQNLAELAITECPKPATYCWSYPDDTPSEATAHESVDWAVCCAMPIPGEQHILLYLAGSSGKGGAQLGYTTQSGSRNFLRDTTRLVGFVADTIGRAISLQKVEQWQSRLGRFFSSKLTAKILESEDSKELEPKIAEATVMFFDIRGFSLLTEGNLDRILEYESQLREVLTAMTQCIYDYEGAVLRYMGDGILACWNVPYPTKGHSILACKAALDMVDKMAEVTDGWACGIGLGLGDVVAGSLGSEQIYAYDILGAVANQTARVEGITKIVGVPILVTHETAQTLTDDKILSRRVARFRPAGMELELDLYTIERNPEDSDQRKVVQDRLAVHADGLKVFEAGDWEKAFDILHPIVQDDPAARYVYKLAIQGKPPRDWRGVVELSAK